jgi:UDPglucose--hexose-1-phosphate uridylyltransferase
VTHLADGRELIYYDEAEYPHRGQPDRRALPAAPPASQLRYDVLVDEWVTISAHRQERTFLPPANECPLCPSTVDRLTEVPDADYDVVVFQNRFPSYSEQPAGLDGVDTVAPLTPVRPGTGRCEVVCFTAEHDGSFAQLSPGRVRTVLDVLADRTAALAAVPAVAEVFCFENRGVEIGVTLEHPHGQIYGYPFVTPRTRAMTAAASAYATRTGRGLFADLLAAERDATVRVVAATGPRSCRRPHAGRSRSSWRPTASTRTCRLCPLWSLTRSARSTSMCCAGSTHCTARRHRTWRPGGRPRCARTGSWPTCTCSCTASAGHRAG